METLETPSEAESGGLGVPGGGKGRGGGSIASSLLLPVAPPSQWQSKNYLPPQSGLRVAVEELPSPSRSGLTVVVEELASLVIVDEEDRLRVNVGVGFQCRDELRRGAVQEGRRLIGSVRCRGKTCQLVIARLNALAPWPKGPRRSGGGSDAGKRAARTCGADRAG